MTCSHCGAKLDVSEFSVFENIECPSCSELLKVPGKLDEFILLDELGRGAMGCVYLAEDESLGRLVALKVIRKEFGADPKMLETVQREAQAMATLNHRNIVQVYSFGRAEGQPYFVMELLRGERLDEMMEGGKPVDEVRILEIAYDVAQGLEAAERAGLTHGDIKPANILMNDEGVAKVVDFGLAKFMDPDAEIEVWGTPYYIAPEKARKKGEDGRSDQFSLGGTLFHALAGHPPFDGENPTKVVIASLKEETPVLLEHNPGVTEKTSSVIRRMMDKNPSRRYPTYASLLADLEDALREAIAAEEARQAAALAEEENAKKKVPAFVWIVLCTLGVLAAAAGFFALQSHRDRQLALSVEYEGPDRKLHEEQLVRVEVRNLTEAAKLVKEGNLREVEKRLEIAGSSIPENHSAMAWYEFFTAGIYLYAQDTERAKALLEDAAGHEELLFDGGRVPIEDPRKLAKFALGELDPAELQKDLKKSRAYYQHLAQLAQGYRILLEKGYHPEASRSFQRYSELQVAGFEWPYVLVEIAPSLHLPRNILVSRNPLEAKATATPTPRPTSVPRPTAAPRPTSVPRATATPLPTSGSRQPTPTPAVAPGLRLPDFDTLRISQLNENGEKVENTSILATLTPTADGNGIWFEENQVLEQLEPLTLRKEISFIMSIILTAPTTVDTETESMIFALGNSADPENPHGFFLSFRQVDENSGVFKAVWGKGNPNTKEMKEFSISIRAGKTHLISLAWNGDKGQFWFYNNGRANRIFKMKAMTGLVDPDSHLVFGRTISEENTFPERASRFRIHRRFLFDHIPNMENVYREYSKRMKSWDQQ